MGATSIYKVTVSGVPVPIEFFGVMVTVNVPAVRGVPVIAPEVVLKLREAGRRGLPVPLTVQLVADVAGLMTSGENPAALAPPPPPPP